MGRKERFIAMLCIALCGYGVGDLCDVLPGFFTFKPLEDAAQPYPAVKSSAETALSLPSPADAPMPDAAKVQEIVNNLSLDSRIGGSENLGMYVIDAETGEQLGAHNRDDGKVPASTMKIVTAYAALSMLGEEHKFVTKAALSGENLYLVGGGDILLAENAGDPKRVVGRAGIGDLARMVAEKVADTGVASFKVFLDDSRYSGSLYAPGVDRDLALYTLPSSPIAVGYAGDSFAGRGASERVLDTFVAQLRAAGVNAEAAGTQAAPNDVQDIAQVDSASLREIVDFTLAHSDNALADTLQHEVAVASGKAGSFETGSAAVIERLQARDFDLSEVHIVDGSGLSLDNRLTPTLLTQILRAVWTCDPYSDSEEENPQGEGRDTQACPATQIGVGMPFAGVDGTLQSRFTNSSATGRVHAKTGTLGGASALAGYLYTAQGRPLIFAILANKAVAEETDFGVAVRPALDDAVNALASL